MPAYMVRNVPAPLWEAVRARAAREGWPLQALLLALLHAYVAGRVTWLASEPKGRTDV